MPLGHERLDHLLRRASFGASAAERAGYATLPFTSLISRLVDFESVPIAGLDSLAGQDGYLGVTAYSGVFSPNTSITDARQRWTWRMVHSPRPLQEKMALFWHNHFATAYAKLHGAVGPEAATRMLAQVPAEHPAAVCGQLELFRTHALGRYRDLLFEVARDPAMLVWLDGRANTRLSPDENFGRELLELFSIGTGEYTEADVQSAARVFSGWNLRPTGAGAAAYYRFAYTASAHDTNAKPFSFPIYSNGARTIPSRAAAGGWQDGVDLITALARHPATARRLARKLYAFFVNELHDPPPSTIETLAAIYLQNGTAIRPMVRHLLESPELHDPASVFARYSWPVEFVVRAIKEVGVSGYSAVQTIPLLIAMGQSLFEPPNVGGWKVGANWFSTGRMLGRMNFAASLCGNQHHHLVDMFRGAATTPDALVAAMLERLSPAPLSAAVRNDLVAFVSDGTGTPWRGGEGQIHAKIPALARLVVGAPEYQLV